MTGMKWTYSFQGNRLTGHVPWDALSPLNVQSLNIGNNALSGTIPPTVSNLKVWKNIDVSANRLSGTLPTEVGELYTAGTPPAHSSGAVSASWLNIGSNALSGTLPSEIGQINLRSGLIAGRNAFSGTLPAALASPSLSRWFDVQSNRLSGSVPTEFGGLMRIDVFSLSHNNFQYPTATADIAAYQDAATLCVDTRKWVPAREILGIGASVSCYGVPPNSCSAFGGGSRKQSWADPTMCMQCDGAYATIALPLVATLAFLLVLGRLVHASVRYSLRHPAELRKWVAAPLILVTHAQTTALLCGMRIGWPRSLRFALDSTIHSLKLEQFACFLGDDESGRNAVVVQSGIDLENFSITTYMTSFDASLIGTSSGLLGVLLCIVAFGRLAERCQRRTLADIAHVTLSVVFVLQLSVTLDTVAIVWVRFAAATLPPSAAGMAFAGFTQFITFPLVCIAFLINLFLIRHFWRCLSELKKSAQLSPERRSFGCCVLGNTRRLARRMVFLTGRFAPHAPRWQFVIWLRQLALFALSLTSQLLLPSLDSLEASSSQVPERFLVAAGAFAITIAAWLAHHRYQPYAMQYQNRLDSALHASNVALIVLSTIAMSLPQSDDGGRIALEAVMLLVLLGTFAAAVAYVCKKRSSSDDDDMKGGLSSSSSSSFDAMKVASSISPIEVALTMAEPDISRVRGQKIDELHAEYVAQSIADSRLIHLVKGLAASALTASDAVSDAVEALGNDRPWTPPSAPSTRALLEQTKAALRETLDTIALRQVLHDLEAGRYVSNRVECDLGSVLRAHIRDDEGEVHLEPNDAKPGEPPMLWLAFDEVCLRIVINEALSNCRKHAEPGTPIIITARHTVSDVLRVTVQSQNAFGASRLTEEACRAVMERGARGSNATAKGSGLGLDTARKASNAAGGTVWLATRREGDKGTGTGVGAQEGDKHDDDDDQAITYTSLIVEFPATLCDPPTDDSDRPPSSGQDTDSPSSGDLAESTPSAASIAALESEEPEGSAPSPANGMRIMVVDDSAIGRMILRHVLSEAIPNSTFVEASDTNEMFRMVRRHMDMDRSMDQRISLGGSSPMGFDMFCIDEYFHDCPDGSEAFTELCELRAKCAESAEKVLFVSVTAIGDDPNQQLRLLAAGADLVWSKPIPKAATLRLSVMRALHIRQTNPNARARLASAARFESRQPSAPSTQLRVVCAESNQDDLALFYSAFLTEVMSECTITKTTSCEELSQLIDVEAKADTVPMGFDIFIVGDNFAEGAMQSREMIAKLDAMRSEIGPEAMHVLVVALDSAYSPQHEEELAAIGADLVWPKLELLSTMQMTESLLAAIARRCRMDSARVIPSAPPGF